MESKLFTEQPASANAASDNIGGGQHSAAPSRTPSSKWFVRAKSRATGMSSTKQPRMTDMIGNYLDKAIESHSRSTELFDKIDQNGDGYISREEFEHVYKSMREHIRIEHQHELEQMEAQRRSARRIALLRGLIVIILPTLLLLLASQTGLVYSVVEMSKEVRLRGGRLTDDAGNPVATAVDSEQLALVDLPATADFEAFNRLEKVTIIDEANSPAAALESEDTDPATLPQRAVKLSRWSWISTERMVLYGDDGTTILLNNGAMDVANPTDGLVRFHPGSMVAVGAGSAKGNAAVQQAVRASCVSHACQLAECVGHDRRHARPPHLLGHHPVVVAPRRRARLSQRDGHVG